MQINVNPSVITLACENRPIINARLVPLGSLSIGALGLVSATANNKILFAGGVRDAGNGARVDIYDITTNTWSTAELSKGDRQVWLLQLLEIKYYLPVEKKILGVILQHLPHQPQGLIYTMLQIIAGP